MSNPTNGGTGLPARRSDLRPLLRDLAQGNAVSMADKALALTDGDARAAALQLASVAIELRRESVAVIGDHEAFIRKGTDGALRQIIRPVCLSEDSGDLYQILKNVKRGGQWVANPAAALTFQGYLKINAVAGLSVGNPPQVVVDGQPRSNPYIERDPKGGIKRVVISVVVIGPSPATGNPVAIQYLLDYEPRKDLLHMLATLDESNEGVSLVTQDDERCSKPGHKFVELYDGVGYVCDLTHKSVRELWKAWINLLQNAVKKAQTVARRNAMAQHPGIGGHKSVLIDELHNARVPVIGWTGDETTLNRYQSIAESLSRGLPLPDDAEIIETETVYEPEEHSQGAADLEEPGSAQESDEDGVVDEAPEVSEEDLERAMLIGYIDQGIGLLKPAEVNALEYEPEGDTLERLREIKAILDAAADGAEG